MTSQKKMLLCAGLPTKALEGTRVLVTGASGYIGGVLIPELLARGYKVRAMVRSKPEKYEAKWPGVEVILADVLNYTQLTTALQDIDVAYYLVHSLYLYESFSKFDSYGAMNFRKAAEENHVKRIIYLSSLGNNHDQLSKHLSSRIETATLLSGGTVPVTVLRAAIIIGEGSASYAIVKNLVKYCPLFLLPSWANTLCQPISIRDVIRYMVACLENKETIGKTFDIGGKDVLTYKDILRIQAKVLNKKRLFIDSKIGNIALYAHIGKFMTPIPYKLIKVLMESCTNEVVCENDNIAKVTGLEPLDYIESLSKVKIYDTRNALNGERKEKPIRSLKKEVQHLVPFPPVKSKNLFTDLYYFLFLKARTPTLIRFKNSLEKEEYCFRILQRLNLEVMDLRILNIHQIGVNAPAKYVFEELLKWDGDSTCWPNYLAKVVRRSNKLENLMIYLLGITRRPLLLKFLFGAKEIRPLFKMDVIKIQRTPIYIDSDNARFLLYKCSGGYPIGFFTMYTRSSIEEIGEQSLSQLFLIVGFNFYGKERLSQNKQVKKLWEAIHNRVTSQVLNKVKDLSEWRFNSIQTNDTMPKIS